MAGPLKKTFFFSLLMAVGALLVAEALLQLATASSRTVSAALSANPVRGFVADRELSWRGNPEYPEHDARGFRNASVPPQVRVVALGDSQTYGSNVSREEAWPHHLDDVGLGPSYDMGFPGWGPLQGYLILDEALELRPRFVVQAIYLGNDLVDAFTFVYDRGRLPRFKSTDEELRGAFAEAAEREPWDDNPIADQSPIDRDDQERPEAAPRTLVEWVQAHSRLYGLWSALGRAYDYYQRHPYRAESDDEHDPLRDDDFIRFRGSSFSTVLTPNYRLSAVQLDDPRVLEGLRITLDAMREMRDHAETADARFAVLLIPTKELALADVVAAELGRLPTDLAFHATAEERAREALHDELSTEGIRVIDALPVLQELAGSGVLPYSETRDGHLSPAGHQALAQVVRDALMDSSTISR